MFELLHVFADCRKTNDWENYYEILSHVVSRKNLFRKTPRTPNEWHLGLLIPAPTSPSGESRWYCNDAFNDDHNGDVSYVLFPACRNYCDNGRSLPMIKLYRSTCSGGGVVNFQDSIASDLYPWGSPGQLMPSASSRYFENYINERSIPLWMGYLISAKEMKTRKSDEERKTYENRLMNAGKEFLSYFSKKHPKDKRVEALLWKKIHNKEWEELEAILTEYGHFFKEDPEGKISQDIAFVGHSLGGAFAQHGVCAHFTDDGRIAVPGNTVACYSSDGPAIDNEENTRFIDFGRAHRKLLNELGVKIRVIHRFEYGDPVPQVGGSHLGATPDADDEDCSWLDFSAAVYRPKKKALARDVVTPGIAHARRFGLAKKGEDYTVRELTQKSLDEFDHAIWLQGDLLKTFGYRFLRSPKTAESVRRVIGVYTRPLMKIWQWVSGNQIGARDAQGAFAIDNGH
jgi:hypothetical protein